MRIVNRKESKKRKNICFFTSAVWHWLFFVINKGGSLYELRHTFVSVIQQLPELTVKALVGHSKAMDTEIYNHEMQGYGQKTANNLENIFGEILEEKKA